MIVAVKFNPDRGMEISIQYHVMLIRQSSDQILMRCYIKISISPSWNGTRSIPRSAVHFCTIRFVLHFIRHNHDRNAIVIYLTAIVCNCYTVTDGIELKYTICAKQNGGCKNNYISSF